MDKLLADAKRSAFTIPRFQRDFVWTIGQVKLLIDSIARNYPIGSLLLLAETDPAQPFLRSRPVQAVLNEDASPTTVASEQQPNQFYVLDGQQRLTSIVRVFLQASPDAVYYFDLKKLRDFSNSPTKTDWIIKRGQATKLQKRYLRSDSIIDRQRCQVLVEEYFETSDEDLSGDRPKQREASAKVNSVFETIRNYQVPYVVIDRSESLEAICRIFETINSTGTRLTTFDLAVARFFPEPDLQALWDESRREHRILVQYEVDGERVLQVIALLEAAEQNAVTEATRSVLLNLRKPLVRDRWHDAVSYLVTAYKWAETRGVAPGMFPNEALMVPLAVFFSLSDDKWKRKQPGYQAVLDKWYFSSCLQQGARQASNYRVAEATGELLRWRKEGDVPQAPRVFLTPDQIVRLRSTDSRYRAIMAFLRWQMEVDLWTDEPLVPTDVEDHHIFPAASAKRHGIDRVLLDSVSNRLLVSAGTNRTLGDRLPQDYLVKLIDESKKAGHQRRRRDLLRNACISLPDDRDDIVAALEVSNAAEFIKSRAERIYESLEKILEDALIPSDTEEDD
jgi:hypothetical protein